MPGQGQGGLCRRCNRPTSKHKHKQANRSQEHKLQVSTQNSEAQNQYKAHKIYKIHHRDTSKQADLMNTSCIEAHNITQHTISTKHTICVKTQHTIQTSTSWREEQQHILKHSTRPVYMRHQILNSAQSITQKWYKKTMIYTKII